MLVGPRCTHIQLAATVRAFLITVNGMTVLQERWGRYSITGTHVCTG